jgi:hypothetical protein
VPATPQVLLIAAVRNVRAGRSSLILNKPRLAIAISEGYKSDVRGRVSVTHGEKSGLRRPEAPPLALFFGRKGS